MDDEVDSWGAAEAFAAEFLRRAGYADSATTGSGADRGIDVQGGGVLAQVKHHSKPVGRPDIQRLYGARGGGRQALYFFSLSGFTPHAVEYARQHDIGLLQYDRYKNVSAITPAAFAASESVRSRDASEREARQKLAKAEANWAGTRFEVIYQLMKALFALGLVIIGIGLVIDSQRAYATAGGGTILAAVSCFIYLFVAGGTVDTPPK